MSGADGTPERRLEDPPPPPPAVAPHEEPPAALGEREERWAETPRDMTAAVGTRGEPGEWRRSVQGADVALARPRWGDAAWSYLFKRDTSYADVEPGAEQVPAANRRGREAPMPEQIHGPMMKPPVWTWEVPLYFWVGGIAAGSSFVALAADVAGDAHSARIARRVAVGAVMPAPLLLIADLGRPARFLNMLRIFKPRSPMNLGAWCLISFSAVGSAAVGADLLKLRRVGPALGGVNAVLGGYLGSYTGVLLASTAVPLWARSRLFLGPIFVSTAAATGAAASRLTLAASGLPDAHPTRRALGTIEAGAMLTELTLSTLNERRLGRLSDPLETGRPGRLLRTAKLLVHVGLGLQVARKWFGPRAHDVASVSYLAAGLAFRFAWVEGGKASAHDDEAVARMARGQGTVDDRLRGDGGVGPRTTSELRRPAGGLTAGRLWTEGVRRASLLVECAVRRG